ncbi:MAG: hypothetical protein HOA04_00160 [Euryarchaeota archaeon]|jgi:hypothetical protein|nr:hypothetical protein [Euryarchaeota archaeon]MBT7938559.1 hypothetical protein [Euryarchaeota archaeon]
MDDMNKLIETMTTALEIWIERAKEYMALEAEEELKEAEDMKWKKLEIETTELQFTYDFQSENI